MDFWYLEIFSRVKMLMNFHPCELTFHSGRAHHLCNSSFVPDAMTVLEVLLWACSFGFLTVTHQKYLAGTTVS